MSAAIRTRSEGEWRGEAHYGKLEIGRGVMNSLTRAAKDTLVIEVNEHSNKRPVEESKDAAHDGECEQHNTCDDVQVPPIVIGAYELDTIRPETTEAAGAATPPTPERRGAEDSSYPALHDLQEPATRYHCLRYARSEEMKARRRLVGDKGGIKFKGKMAVARDDGCTNTLTAVLKDNLILCAIQT